MRLWCTTLNSQLWGAHAGSLTSLHSSVCTVICENRRGIMVKIKSLTSYQLVESWHWFEPSWVPWVKSIYQPPPIYTYTGHGETKEQGRPLQKRLVLGGHKRSRSLHPPARSFQVYKETLTGSRWSQQHTVLSRFVLKAASSAGKATKTYSPRTRVGSEELQLLQLTAQIHLAGQLAVLSSQWPTPTPGCDFC